jgi:hypothetical protein
MSPNINGKKRDEEILRSVGEYEDQDSAEFLDLKTYSDKKSINKASVAIDAVLRGEKPVQWYGATVAFIQKIVDVANDRRATLGDKYKILLDYAMSHTDIVKSNIERRVAEESAIAGQQMGMQGAQPAQQGQTQATAQPQPSQAVNPGVSGGMSRAMSIANSA